MAKDRNKSSIRVFEGFGNHASSYEEADFINVLDWEHKPENLKEDYTLTLSDFLSKKLRVHRDCAWWGAEMLASRIEETW